MSAHNTSIRFLIAVVAVGAMVSTPARAAEKKPIAGSPAETKGYVSLFDGTSFDQWKHEPWHRGHWTARGGMINYDGKAEGKKFEENTLWTKKSYGDFILRLEWRLPSKPKTKPHPIVLPNGDFLRDANGKRKTTPRLDAGDSGIYLRGSKKCQANIWSQVLGSGEINGYRVDRKLPDEIRKACLPSERADRPFGQWNEFEITMQGDRMTVVLNGVKVIDAAKLPGVPKSGPIGLQHHGDPAQFRNLLIKERNGSRK